MKLRSLFISDVHLGSRHAKTEYLLEFLKQVKRHTHLESLYIVGDFVDGWKLKRSWYWTDECSLILRKVLSFVKEGTRVYCVAGNHDEFLREFIHDFPTMEFGSIQIGDEFIHETADGRHLLVVHGDRFDLVTKYAKWLCHLGDFGYEFAAAEHGRELAAPLVTSPRLLVVEQSDQTQREESLQLRG